jgi:hypothetical protein
MESQDKAISFLVKMMDALTVNSLGKKFNEINNEINQPSDTTNQHINNIGNNAIDNTTDNNYNTAQKETSSEILSKMQDKSTPEPHEYCHTTNKINQKTTDPFISGVNLSKLINFIMRFIFEIKTNVTREPNAEINEKLKKLDEIENVVTHMIPFLESYSDVKMENTSKKRGRSHELSKDKEIEKKIKMDEIEDVNDTIELN